MKNWHIHIKGMVQGVGFRPFVYWLAHEMNVNGTVMNTVNGVHIQVGSDMETAELFLEYLLKQAPPLAFITDYVLEPADPERFEDFRIIESTDEGIPNLLITPDVAMCPECRKELKDPANRRFNYPFITCTHCGPRFSIMQSLPYDRIRTTMDPFNMCTACEPEYNDPLDRRHFSQTNSCPDCRISLSYHKSGKTQPEPWNDEEIMDRIISDWKQGLVVAIKGIGGYLLTCDATNEKAIWNLRERKLRPGKPFALMYPDIETLEKDVWISGNARHELQHKSAPIVLMPMHKHPESGIKKDLINPGLERLGAMLPYTPLYEILMERFGKPVVATSGNLSGSPILYKDQTALRELARLADVIIPNDREIEIPQDDSVISFSDVTQDRIVLRRSRGMAPSYFQKEIDWPEKKILAMGADMKSVFSMLAHGNLYISQYLGDLDSFLSQLSFEATLKHFHRLVDFKPEVILADLHPNYHSSGLAEKIAKETEVPLVRVQHHIAHFCSVLAENNLMKSDRRILGVIWDGLGYGNDAAIWGGEFFTFRKRQFRRVFHLPYYDYLLGDKMSREPRLSALSLLKNRKECTELLKPRFSDQEWELYHRMLEKRDPIQTSSMGRLFDAVSALLLGIDKLDYQGEAAIKLEQEARHFFYTHNPEHRYTYIHGSPVHFTEQLFDGILRDLKKNKPRELIAARFHISLVDLILHIARTSKSTAIAFSGGVFQNALLVDLIRVLAHDHLQLYFHKRLSPNDESIAFGQMAYYIYSMEKEKNPFQIIEGVK